MTIKTSAITNPLATTGSSASAKTGAPADMPFGQVLSREVSNRNSANELNAASTKDGDTAARTPQAAHANPSPSKPTEANAAEEGKTMSSAESTTTAADEGKIASTPNDAREEEEATLDVASAELLALVASLNQMTAAQSTPSGDTYAVSEEGQNIVAEAVIGGQSADDEAQLIVAQQISTSDAAVNVTSDSAINVLTNAANKAETNAGTISGLASPSIDVAKTVGTSQSIGMAQANPKPVSQAADIRSKPSSSAMANIVDSQTDAADVDSNASLAQAKGGVPVLEASAPKPLPGQMEFAAAATKSHSPAMSQDTSTTAAPINIATLSTAQQPQVQTAASAAANNLTPHVGNPGWDQALGQKVVWMVSNAQQSASLTLNPPDLGPLQVVLNVSNNQATANFTAAHPEVRQVLENAMPKLREMLGEAGIQLGQANVSAGTPNSQQDAYAQREQGRQSSRDASRTDDRVDTSVHVSHSQVVAGGRGLVDTFV